MSERQKLGILIPVYNEWNNLDLLLGEIEKQLTGFFDEVRVFIVNDASSVAVPKNLLENHKGIEIIHLTRNLGHQKAIAIGISYLADKAKSDLFVVMDGDGEDAPEDILQLVKESSKYAEKVIFAKRQKRKNALFFRMFYMLYKFVFRLFTGKPISFGNFCVIPGSCVNAIAHVSEIWNHFSGGIMKSKIPYRTLPLNRRKRMSGRSKMSLTSLMIHGISSVSVYLDVVAVRLLIFFSFLIGMAIVGLFVVISLRVFTDLAIPGWASTIGLGLVLIVLQSFFVLLMLSFMILSYRSQMQFIPGINYSNYISKVEKYDGLSGQ